MSADGGCLCGAVRYRVTGDPVAATLSHCQSCRRASGGTNVAWAVFDKAAFEATASRFHSIRAGPGLTRE